MKKAGRLGFVIGLIILLGGLNITILLSHLSRWFGVLLIFIGLGIIFFSTKGDVPVLKKPDKKIKEKHLAARLINLISINGRLIPFFPVLGAILIVLLACFNLFVASDPHLGSNDYVVLILAGILFAYNYIPKKFSIERDFALLFISFLVLILVIPTTIYSVTCSTEPDTNSVFTYYLLSLPTTGLATLFGIDVTIVAYNILEVIGPNNEILPVSIGISCTGLYSVAIFVSAFIAFVAVEYRRFDRKVGMLLGIGIVLAWVANIIRMTIILAVGKYYGRDPMLWTHNNIGEIIFMIWVSIFWLVMFRYLGVLDDLGDKEKPKKEDKPSRGRMDTGHCEICETTLSHSIPAYRCKCGKIYHEECTLNFKNCPNCHRVFQRDI